MQSLSKLQFKWMALADAKQMVELDLESFLFESKGFVGVIGCRCQENAPVVLFCPVSNFMLCQSFVSPLCGELNEDIPLLNHFINYGWSDNLFTVV